MIKNVHEILDEVAAAKNNEDRKAILYYNNNYALRQILKAAFDPKIKFVFEKVPYYRPSDAPIGLGETNLHKEVNRLYLFEEGNPSVSPNLTQQRKEQLLIQMLESIEAKDAVVLMNALLKNLKIPGLTKKIVEDVFPDLLK
jgi:hypothetical protein